LKEAKVIEQHITDKYAIYHGDSCEVMKGIPTDTIHYEIYSPPFINLYTYSNSERDLGNCFNNDEFYKHFEFIVKELYRVLMPGRLMSVHCMDIPVMKERDGYIGLNDFPGYLIQLFQKIGFIYHSRVTIWKDPLVEATRTKSIGLMHKQIVKDSAMCRQGLPDYLLTFRKLGVNPEPIAHPEGFTNYIGEECFTVNKKAVLSHHIWRRYASPVWMDISQSNTLQYRSAREDKDEKHICPLQLDVIRRAVELWTNKGDVVLSPFGGIGSEPVVVIEMGRKAIAIELKESYYRQMKANCKNAVNKNKNRGILGDLGDEEK
jgi:DNA modification methylase